MRPIEQLIRDWQGAAVLSRFDAASDSWFFIALHDDTLGPPVGGTRYRVYASPEEGLLDAMRLAEGMTFKWAALEFASGGGKGVIAASREHEGEPRRALFRRYGRFVELLRGGFATGRDLGTSADDMLAVAQATRHVHGVDPGGPTDPGPYTARGVHAAMRAVWSALGGNTMQGCHVLIQGTGAVGGPLARQLAAAGARLTLADADAVAAAELAAELGARTVDAAAALATPCDVLAPCAIGGVVNERTIPELACRAIAGSANNQLGDEQDAQRLHEAGVLYAPDFIANGGGALVFGSIARGERDEAVFARRLDAIEDGLSSLFADAAKRDESPLVTARRRIDERLAGGKDDG